MALCTCAALALALAIVALCSGSAAVAIVALPFAIDFSVLFNGFITWPAFQAAGWAWISYFSYVAYAYAGIAQNELAGLEIVCAPEELDAAGACPSGDDFLAMVGLTSESVGENAACMVAYTAVAHLVGYLGFRFLKR